MAAAFSSISSILRMPDTIVETAHLEIAEPTLAGAEVWVVLGADHETAITPSAEGG